MTMSLNLFLKVKLSPDDAAPPEGPPLVAGKRTPLISERMRRLLPPLHVPRKPRTRRIEVPMGDAGGENTKLHCLMAAALACEPAMQIETEPMRKKTRRVEIDLNLPPVTDSETEEETQNPDCFQEPRKERIKWNFTAPETPDVVDFSLSPVTSSDVEMAEGSTSEKKKKERKRRTIKKTREIGPLTDMPAGVREKIAEMGGTNIQLVIQKILTTTDLNRNHGRLSLPPKKLIEKSLVTAEEEAELESSDEEKRKKGMRVRMFDGEMRESGMCFKKWKIGSKQTYCMMTNWNSYVRETGLKAGDEIQLWSFRAVPNAAEDDQQRPALCFIVIKIQTPLPGFIDEHVSSS